MLNIKELFYNVLRNHSILKLKNRICRIFLEKLNILRKSIYIYIYPFSKYFTIFFGKEKVL